MHLTAFSPINFGCRVWGIVPALFLGVFATEAGAGEFFVNKAGLASNDGLSRQQAFPTIQQGVSALGPGDTLIIGPGEYFEAVSREKLGNADADTIIRAELPGTVVLRGDVNAPEFQKVEGFRFVYAAKFDREPQVVLEVDTMTPLKAQFRKEDVEFTPGAYFYDAAESMLFVSSTDLQDTSRHRYTISVIPQSGLLLADPQRVRVEGLVATGYFSNKAPPLLKYEQYNWGIVLMNPIGCKVRDCVAYLNDGGIGVIGGSGNVVEQCLAYRNTPLKNGESGNIVKIRGNNDVIRDCIAYGSMNGNGNIVFYSELTGPGLLKNNISWDGYETSMRIKGEGRTKFGKMENCVSFGMTDIDNVSHSLVVGRNSYNENMSADNVTTFPPDAAFQYADPPNLDFRLQSKSSLRGSGPAGVDRGPFPFQENVFYVSPSGSDTNDGLSVSTAWSTLSHALGRLKGGDTLYLLKGTYTTGGAVRLAGSREKPVSLRGRGKDRVIVKGELLLENVGGADFRRLHFDGGVRLAGGGAVGFENCMFTQGRYGIQAAGVNGLRVTHCVFTQYDEAGINLVADGAPCTDVYLSGNIFDNKDSAAVKLAYAEAVIYSDYNSYRETGQVWRLPDGVWDFARLQKNHDTHSQNIIPEFRKENDGLLLENAWAFGGRGPHGRAMGLYDLNLKRPLRMEGPFVHSVSDTTANLEWWMSGASRCIVAWGETRDCENTKEFDVGSFGTFSLAGLKPGTKYFFRIQETSALSTGNDFEKLVEKSLRSGTISFQTDEKPRKPATYFISTTGDDQQTGLKRSKAWRSISKAAARARPGDTVLLVGGTYREIVRLRVTGDVGKPITFRCAPGERVQFDGFDLGAGTAFAIAGKQDVRFDGFYFEKYNLFSPQILGISNNPSIFEIYQSDRISITRCLSDGSPRGKAAYRSALVWAKNCRDLLIQNCVIANGMHGLSLHACPAVRLENNVFLRNFIQAMTIGNIAADKIHLRKNIITDSLESKVGVQTLEIPDFRSLDEDDNCYFMRLPDEKRRMFAFYNEEGQGGFKTPENPMGRASLGDYSARVGKKSGSIFANPSFRRAAGMKEKYETGEPVFSPDLLADPPRDQWESPKLDFADLFSANPELIERGIGLNPEAFSDFGFPKK